MLSKRSKIAVCSRSFSRNPTLRAELLTEFDNVKFNDSGRSLAGDDLVDFLRGCDGAIIALELISKDILDQLPELKVIGKYGVGLNNIDLSACSARNVRLGWTAGVNANSVAELTLTMALMLRRRVPSAIDSAMSTSWTQIVGRELSGATVGVIGCGHVGSRVLELLRPFEVEKLVCDVKDKTAVCRAEGASQVGISELMAASDLITVHVPLTEATRNLISVDQVALCKPTAILINTARGGIVDESAILSAIHSRALGGFGTDVLLIEPPDDMTRFKHENILVTSHVGGSSEEAILAMGRSAIAGLLQSSTISAYEGML